MTDNKEPAKLLGVPVAWVAIFASAFIGMTTLNQVAIAAVGNRVDNAVERMEAEFEDFKTEVRAELRDVDRGLVETRTRLQTHEALEGHPGMQRRIRELE